MAFKLRIHRSFAYLFLMLAVVMAAQGRGWDGLLQFAAGFAVLFLAVIAHELSHAFVARALGVPVRDIVVHPLGGMTRLLWTARDPRKEALISCAGPAVNLVIGVTLWAAFRDVLDRPERWAAWFVLPLVSVNLALGVLNLVPAFPMDGGRILRAVLSVRFGHLRATRVAARVGRWIAALTLCAPVFAPAIGWTFWQSLALPVVGLFVFVLGEIELKQAEVTELFGAEGPFAQSRPGTVTRQGAIDVEATARVLDEE